MKGHRTISQRKFIDTVTAPGTVNLLTGRKGKGKTATFVSMLQPAVEGTIEGYEQQIDIITNIVFAQGGVRGRSMPPGLHYAESVEQMFRIMLEIYEERGEKARIVIGMDEAHQHMLADNNGDPVNQAMLKFLAVIRKFNVSIWFMSPVRGNLAPKIRNFIDETNKAGNLDFLWFKDQFRAEQFIRVNGLNTKPYQYITWQGGADHESKLLFVRFTSWMTKVDQLRPGEYGYDDESVATFRCSDHPDFDHQTLIDMCSGFRKNEMPDRIALYFEMLDAGEFADKKKGGSVEDDQVMRVKRARDADIPWKTIEVMEGAHRNTLRSRMKKLPSSQNTTASKNDDDDVAMGGTT